MTDPISIDSVAWKAPLSTCLSGDVVFFISIEQDMFLIQLASEEIALLTPNMSMVVEGGPFGPCLLKSIVGR